MKIKITRKYLKHFIQTKLNYLCLSKKKRQLVKYYLSLVFFIFPVKYYNKCNMHNTYAFLWCINIILLRK